VERDAILGLEDEQTGKEVGDVRGGLEFSEGTEEFAADGGMREARGCTGGVEQAEIGAGVVG
jgi:hypothetical protein